MATQVETELRNVNLEVPMPVDSKMGIDNIAFEDGGQIDHKDTEDIFHEPKSKDSIIQRWKWRFEGMNLVTLSVVILSVALTISLIINVIFGNPQVMPHGAVGVDNNLCGRYGLTVLQKEKGNAVDAAVATLLCLTVTRPDIASLAGCGAILVRDRNKQVTYSFDFLCPSSKLLTPSSSPSKSRPATLVGIPGLIKGLATVHRQFGQKNWADLFHGAINACESGFQPDKVLVDAASQYNISKSGRIGPIVSKLLSGQPIYKPPINLCQTLRNLADFGPNYFYSSTLTDKPSIKTLSSIILAYMKEKGIDWSVDDFQNYTVQQPQPLQMRYAGFTLESLPAPVIGGPFLLLLLGNLDLKDNQTPLDRTALSKGDPKVTSVYLNRLIQLTQLIESDVSKLGDVYDPAIGAQSTKDQNLLFSTTNRESTVRLINDGRSSLSPRPMPLGSEEYSGIGSTGIVVTDSVSLTITANVFMGSPFGTEELIPNTGIHLNSALGLFALSETQANKTVLNAPAPGRRPLTPIGPVYMSTTNRKCGIRAGVTAAGGWWGLVDMAQVLSNALQFLRNTSCYSQSNPNTPDTAVISDASLSGSNHHSVKSPSRSTYSPAADQKCLNPSGATYLERLHPKHDNSTLTSAVPILIESNYPTSLVDELSGFGYAFHNIEPQLWPGRVFLAGWNGYEMISSGDNRCRPNSNGLYTY